MNVAVVFPPSLCLPNQMYFSLPMLAGALRRGGHRPAVHDLNLLALDRFLTDGMVERYVGLAWEQHGRIAEQGDRVVAERLRLTMEENEPKLRDGPACKALLRDRERFFDKRSFRHAFWNVVDGLAFYYQMDPIISPHRETFGADMLDYQRRDPWTPLQDLYEESLLDTVLADDPGLVCLSVAFPEQAVESVRFVRRVRARAPDVHIAMGGPLIAQYADKWLADGWLLRYADSVCIGDGETAVCELADALERGSDPGAGRNLVTLGRDGSVRRPSAEPFLERMDDLPVPDFDAADMGLYLTPQPIYPLMTSRGCYWGRCTFCSIGWRENFRIASEEKLRTDVADLARRGARYIQVQDSSLPPRSALLLARAIKDEGLDAGWVAGMKFENTLLDEGYCKELAEGGCRSLIMGFESATQGLVDLMDKGFRVDDVPTILANIKAHGISAELLWFVGFPGETRGQALETLRYLYERRGDFGLAAFVSEYQLHPDTIVFDEPERFGVTVREIGNGACDYSVDSGMQVDELLVLKRALSCTNNRTLVCNGSHLPHLVERGPDLAGLKRPISVPDEVVAFCNESGAPPRSERSAFFEDDFGFRSRLEAAYPAIRSEWDRLSPDELKPWPEVSAYDGEWKSFALWIAGRKVERNCDMCPATAAILAHIPGLYTAGFSVLGAHTSLPLHHGERADMLRCHLGVAVPDDCAIKLQGEERQWEEGRVLIFDDTLEHEAWNRSDAAKVVLLIDFAAPAGLQRGDAVQPAQDTRDADHYTELFPGWIERPGWRQRLGSALTRVAPWLRSGGDSQATGALTPGRPPGDR